MVLISLFAIFRVDVSDFLYEDGNSRAVFMALRLSFKPSCFKELFYSVEMPLNVGSTFLLG